MRLLFQDKQQMQTPQCIVLNFTDLLGIYASTAFDASGRRSSKRVPVEDLGNNATPLTLHVIKGDLVGPGEWSVINDPQTNVIGLGSQYNQHSHGRLCTWIRIHTLLGTSRE